MEVQDFLNILCFFTKVKEDKRFYLKHETEINSYIELIKVEIETQQIQSKSTINLKSIRKSIPKIIQLILEYFNSS